MYTLMTPNYLPHMTRPEVEDLLAGSEELLQDVGHHGRERGPPRLVVGRDRHEVLAEEDSDHAVDVEESMGQRGALGALGAAEVGASPREQGPIGEELDALGIGSPDGLDVGFAR